MNTSHPVLNLTKQRWRGNKKPALLYCCTALCIRASLCVATFSRAFPKNNQYTPSKRKNKLQSNDIHRKYVFYTLLLSLQAAPVAFPCRFSGSFLLHRSGIIHGWLDTIVLCVCVFRPCAVAHSIVVHIVLMNCWPSTCMAFINRAACFPTALISHIHPCSPLHTTETAFHILLN